MKKKLDDIDKEIEELHKEEMKIEGEINKLNTEITDELLEETPNLKLIKETEHKKELLKQVLAEKKKYGIKLCNSAFKGMFEEIVQNKLDEGDKEGANKMVRDLIFSGSKKGDDNGGC